MSNADLAAFARRNPLRIACVAIVLLSAVGIYVMNTRIADSTLLLEQKTAEGTKLAANIRNAVQLPEQVEMISAASKTIQERYIRAGQLATNLQYFYRLEADSGVELIDLRQTTTGQSTKGKTATAGVGFAISVKGDYPSVLGCLQRLESGSHYCRVMSASMSGTSTDRASPLTLSLSLELLGQP